MSDFVSSTKTSITPAEESAKPKRKRSKRVTIQTEHGSVTVAGDGLSLDSLIQILESTLSQARKAKGMKITLSTFVAMLRDQARAV